MFRISAFQAVVRSGSRPLTFDQMGSVTTATPPAIAECRWSRQGKTITISLNGVAVSRLQFDGRELVDPEGAPSPYVRESR